MFHARRFALILVALVQLGCGVSREEYAAKSQEADAAKAQAAALQQQVASDAAELAQLKSALGLAQSQALTDEQKAQLEEAQERGKLLADLQAKFKSMIDAGHLKVTTRHGRIVLQLHNDVLFDTGEADVKPAGKTALSEIAATLRTVGGGEALTAD